MRRRHDCPIVDRPESEGGILVELVLRQSRLLRGNLEH
jgi:hypothetical protein